MGMTAQTISISILAGAVPEMAITMPITLIPEDLISISLRVSSSIQFLKTTA
jgi:hypothetical protein